MAAQLPHLLVSTFTSFISIDYFYSARASDVPLSKCAQCMYRVKSGIFGLTAKFGHPLSLYHSSIIEIQIN